MPYINHSLSFRGISSGQSHWLLPLMQGELALDSVMTRFAEAGYEPDGDFWWAVAGKGKTRVRFIIEHV